MLAGFPLLGLATQGKLHPAGFVTNPAASPEMGHGTRSHLAYGCRQEFCVALGMRALFGLAMSSSATSRLVRQHQQLRPQRRTRVPPLLLHASRADETTPIQGLLSRFLARFRGSNRQLLEARGQLLERELREAQALKLQAEKRAELFQSKLQEEEGLKNDLEKQLVSLTQEVRDLSDRLGKEETEAAQKYQQATLQLSASKSESEAMTKRLQRAAEMEKEKETEQKKLAEQLRLASKREQVLRTALKQRENKLAEVGTQRDQFRASEADSQQQLRDAQSQLRQLTARLDDFKDTESREEALSAQLAKAHARNELLDERLQEAECEIENFLKEKKQSFASKGAGKGRGKGTGKGKGRSRN